MAEETEVIETNTLDFKFTVVDNNDNEVINTVVEPEIIPQAVVISEIITDENTKEIESEDEYIELNDDVAFEHLAYSKGMSVEDFKNYLTPKEQKKYAPEIEGFQDFYEKTGNKNYNDYLETQKDWSAESEDTRLKSFIKLSNPSLSEEKVQRLFDRKYSASHLDADDEDDKNSILDIEIERENDLIKANQFFEERKEKFKGVGGSDEYIPIEYREAKKNYDSLVQQEERDNLVCQGLRNEYLAKTNQRFNDNFEGFKIKLGNDKFGYNEVAFKPDNINEARDLVSDTNNLMKDFYDKNGNLTKQNELQDALYFGKNYQKLMNQAYNRGIADKIEADDKISKNIQPDNIRPQIQTGSTGVTYTKE